jgi:cell division protein FtsW
MIMFGRTDRSLVAAWWWTIDHWLLTLSIILMLLGILLSMAASPPVAHRLDLDSFHFVRRQLIYLGPAVIVMILASMLSLRQTRRLCLIVLITGLVLMGLTLAIGPEVKGATRWLSLGGLSIQPSEFVKPAFVVVCAWLFAERDRRPDVPSHTFAIALYAGFIFMLVLQPDFGQVILVTLVWGSLFFLAGLSWWWILVLVILGAAGGFTAYQTLPHVAGRVDRFLSPGSGDTFQIDMALQAIKSGGWFGKGPGEGTVKAILPDAHSDFVFAVAAEEFGIIIGLVLVAIFMAIVLLGLKRAFRETDGFARLASSGLIILFGMQALINIGVNLSLLPAKGMTLPFISYGGSSLLSVALTIGLVMGLTRKRAEGELPDQVWHNMRDATGTK